MNTDQCGCPAAVPRVGPHTRPRIRSSALIGVHPFLSVFQILPVTDVTSFRGQLVAFPPTGAGMKVGVVRASAISRFGIIPGARKTDTRTAPSSSCRRRSASTTFLGSGQRSRGWWASARNDGWRSRCDAFESHCLRRLVSVARRIIMLHSKHQFTRRVSDIVNTALDVLIDADRVAVSQHHAATQRIGRQIEHSVIDRARLLYARFIVEFRQPEQS